MSRSLVTLRAASVAALIGIVACSDDPTSVSRRPGAARRDVAADSTPAPVAALVIAPDTARVVVGRTTPLAAIARDTTGNVVEGRTITWSSSADSIATVDSAGVVTGVALGEVTITAASEGDSARAIVAVHDASVYAMSVAPRALVVVAGDTIAMSAAPRDAQGALVESAVVQWSSSADSVAVVDSASGEMRAVAAGETYIRATSGGRSDSAAVVVVPAITGVRVLTPLDTLEAYDTRQMHAVFTDSAGRVVTHGPAVARRTIRWSSSDTSIARIDSITGLLTGVDRGTVTITARSDTLSGTAKRVVVIRYRSLTTGSDHACDIASGGIVWCWGKNGRYGVIGVEKVGDDEYSAEPVRLRGGHRFAQISTYGTTNCGLTIAGKAYCWGYNGWGSLGNGNSSVYYSATPVAVSGGLTFRQISVGAGHTCAVTASDEAYCWGLGGSRQLGNGTTRSSEVPIRAMPKMTFATISAGTDFTCGTTQKGETYCWGFSGHGNLGDGQRVSYGNTYSGDPVLVVGKQEFRGLVTSAYYACGIDAANAGFCWGTGGSGVLGGGSTVNTSTPLPIAGGLKFRALGLGNTHACGIASDASVHCWGSNRNGQLGTGVANGSTKPVRVPDLTASEIGAANLNTGFAAFTCAISADRLTTSCWGRNVVGQLGNGETLDDDVVNNKVTIVVGQKPLPVEK